MHLWGQNIGKQIWSFATDDGQKYGKNNPFFLRNKYRQQMSASLLNAKDINPRSSLDGELVGKLFLFSLVPESWKTNVFLTDMPQKSGFARAVDIIDFLLHVVPTVYVEALENQQADTDQMILRKRQLGKVVSPGDYVEEEATQEVCLALKSVSKACRITQKYSITNEDLEEYKR